MPNPCPRCRGLGELQHAGRSINPATGTPVIDPQETVAEACPDCRGTGRRVSWDADGYDRIADEAAENFERPSERFRALMDERRSHDDPERRAA